MPIPAHESRISYMLWLHAIYQDINLELTLLKHQPNRNDEVLSQKHQKACFLCLFVIMFIFISESELTLFQVGS